MSLSRVPGRYLGLAFPPTIESLLAQGADFLTAAFHAAGTLRADNRVVRVATTNEFFGGGMGRKLLLTLDYEVSDAGLHRELFAKFPRDFGDPLRALFGPLMDAEVRFALLSRHEHFPIVVPKCYFADYDDESVSGLLITERIHYGENGVEPCHAKCKDYELPDPLGHYVALARSMASLAGFQKAGRFGDALIARFPFDPDSVDVGSRIPYTHKELVQKIAILRAFANDYPQLLPAEVSNDEFLTQFGTDAVLVLEVEGAIRHHLNHASEMIALCHWNMNVDNAWFWTDQAGSLQVGLLDWGSVGQMNLAQGFFGMVCSAEAGFLAANRRHLIAEFIAELERRGGPSLVAPAFEEHYRLAVAVLGIAWILDAPSIITAQIPALHSVRDRFDPTLVENFLARAQLQILTVFLSEWRSMNIGAAIRAFRSS